MARQEVEYKNIYTSTQIQWGNTGDWYQYTILNDDIVFLTINVGTSHGNAKLFDLPTSIIPAIDVYQTAGSSGSNMGTIKVGTNGEAYLWSTISSVSFSFVYPKA